MLQMGSGLLGAAVLFVIIFLGWRGEIPDRHTALREIFGALKPGGILGITEVIADPHFQRRANGV